jgi:hypothetical protein
MAVALSPNELERTIEVLSSAGQTLQLTRAERITYRTLLVSVDVALASLLGFVLALIFAWQYPATVARNVEVSWPWWVVGVLATIFIVSLLVGLVALALNIPLLLKTFREGRRLKQLGLSSLSTSLWKESRRGRWISRLRNALILGISILFVVIVVVGLVGMLAKDIVAPFSRDEEQTALLIGVLFYAFAAILLFGARYLRNQRERMELAASAEQLREALQALQQRQGPEVVSVPAEVLERTAIIESAQIKKERKDAVLESAIENTYAVTFERNAAEQRAALGREERLELEDLVADLSTEGAQGETQASVLPDTETPTFRRATENKQCEIDYVVDHASRRIQVVAVRPRAGAASPNGAGND